MRFYTIHAFIEVTWKSLDPKVWISESDELSLPSNRKLFMDLSNGIAADESQSTNAFHPNGRTYSKHQARGIPTQIGVNYSSKICSRIVEDEDIRDYHSLDKEDSVIIRSSVEKYNMKFMPGDNTRAIEPRFFDFSWLSYNEIKNIILDADIDVIMDGEHYHELLEKMEKLEKEGLETRLVFCFS
jgi:hypothetical protein